MSIVFDGLCGPTYAYENQFAAVERCVNLYPVLNESEGERKFRYELAESPGNAPFGTLPVHGPFNLPCRGMIGHSQWGLFMVNGNWLVHVTSAGVYDAAWDLVGATGTLPVAMCFNGNSQLFIGTGFNQAYVLRVDTGILTVISAGDYLCSNQATFQDGYILAVHNGAGPLNLLQISGDAGTPVGDSTIWDPANISVQEGQNDGLQTLISSREYVRIFGSARSQVYYNAGANGLGGFPFQSYNETFIETGIAAPNSLSDLGDSLVWIGQDARGMRAAWRDFAFQPQRISTFAIEQIWQGYATVSDAIAFSFIWKGHLLWQITFPTANVTWVYDATVSQLSGKATWHERTFQTSGTNPQGARPELFHAFCYGKHLVGSGGGDGEPGAVYQYADSYEDHAVIAGARTTVPTLPMRICPIISSMENRVLINRLRVAMQQGVGTFTYQNPQLTLQVSRDSGNTYGPVYSAPLGGLAEFDRITYFNRLGYGRNIVLKLAGDGVSRVPYSFVNGYLDLQELLS